MLDPGALADETVKRRRRDRVLHRILRTSNGNGEIQYQRVSNQGGPSVAAGDDEGDEYEVEDPNAGQYVNYQVGFRYDTTAATSRKGQGLHMLVRLFGICHNRAESECRHTLVGE
jgi:hypothetical protein